MAKKTYRLDDSAASYAAYVLVRQAAEHRRLADDATLPGKFTASNLRFQAAQLDGIANALDPNARALAKKHEGELSAIVGKPALILDPPAPLTPPKRWGKIAELSSEDFAQDIIAVLGQPGAPSVDAREVLLRIKQRRRCHKLVVNGRPAALAEVKQMGARLAREGKLALVGDAMAVA